MSATADDILEKLKQFSPDQPVTLVFTITAGEITDGDYQKLLRDPAVSLREHSEMKVLCVRIPTALWRHPEIKRDSSADFQASQENRWEFKATATQKAWEEVLAGDKLPDLMIPKVSDLADSLPEATRRRWIEADYSSNFFRMPYVRIVIAEPQ